MTAAHKFESQLNLLDSLFFLCSLYPVRLLKSFIFCSLHFSLTSPLLMHLTRAVAFLVRIASVPVCLVIISAPFPPRVEYEVVGH